MRKKLRIDIAQIGFEEIAELFNYDAEQRARGSGGGEGILFVKGTLDQIVQRAGRPCAIAQARVKDFVSQYISRYICQSAALTYLLLPAKSPWGR